MCGNGGGGNWQCSGGYELSCCRNGVFQARYYVFRLAFIDGRPAQLVLNEVATCGSEKNGILNSGRQKNMISPSTSLVKENELHTSTTSF